MIEPLVEGIDLAVELFVRVAIGLGHAAGFRRAPGDRDEDGNETRGGDRAQNGERTHGNPLAVAATRVPQSHTIDKRGNALTGYKDMFISRP